jgi:hypothetical protein
MIVIMQRGCQPGRSLAAVFRRWTPGVFITKEAKKMTYEKSFRKAIALMAATSRKISEIREAEEELTEKAWYNGLYCEVARGIAGGEVRVGDVESPPNLMSRDMWKSFKKLARRLEKKYGRDNLGPWDESEWDMINGKLSALRWVLGAPWDSLSDDDEIARALAKDGWRAIGSNTSPPYVYTCGLMTTFGHPELIMFGLKGDERFAILDAMVNGLQSGRSFAKPGKYDSVTDMWPIAVRKVHPIQHEFYFDYAMEHCRHRSCGLEAMQVFWPDDHGRYPFDVGCDRAVYESQPRLDLEVPPSEPRASPGQSEG